MTLRIPKAVRILRKLRKLLKGASPNPSPEEVHTLRTEVRRLEATLNALAFNQEPEGRRLLKAIAPVRKAAGKVRDIDVLIGNVRTLQGDEPRQSLVRLVEHLAQLRAECARRLGRTITRKRKRVCRGLKLCTKALQRNKGSNGQIKQTTTVPQILLTELRRWPKLTPENLHLFRIRVKELRYMFELSAAVPKAPMEALKRVKDTTGEWHDWAELASIAEKALNSAADRKVLNEITRTRDKNLRCALIASNSLLAHGLRRAVYLQRIRN